MDKGFSQKIGERAGVPDLVDILAEKLSGSELSSLLMEVFARKTASTTPSQLLKNYRGNDFVHPAGTDMVDLMKEAVGILLFMQGRGFSAIELSPAAQLGSCSIMATVDQGKLISALRNTEIVADATNALALHIADLRKRGNSGPPEGLLRYCTVHRHLRTLYAKEKGHMPHFKIACLVTAGVDTGDYRFEKTALLEHLLAWHDLLREQFSIEELRCKLQAREDHNSTNPMIGRVYDHLKESLPQIAIEKEYPETANNYYKGIQFKIIIRIKGMELEIADGGFTDWTAKLLENRKERLLISGMGLELLHKLTR